MGDCVVCGDYEWCYICVDVFSEYVYVCGFCFVYDVVCCVVYGGEVFCGDFYCVVGK